MRLQELFLIETTEEDRALISLSSAINASLGKYAEVEPEYDNPDDEDEGIIRIGKIGQLFDTPIETFNGINIELRSDDSITRYANNQKKDEDVIRDPTQRMILGVWEGTTNTMMLNIDYIGTNTLKTAITHELRHALDDHKSGFKANASKSYSTPRNKEHRRVTKDPYYGNLKYLAEPAEINARFAEVLHVMVPVIKRASKLEPDQVRPKIMKDLKTLLDQNRISELFPEKEKSPQYKRLLKRAVDFINKELAHVQSTK